jgi:hypothetical protein
MPFLRSTTVVCVPPNLLFRENLFEDATAAVTVDGSLGDSTMVSQPIPPRVTADDRNAHRAFVQTLGSKAIWRDYLLVSPVSSAA